MSTQVVFIKHLLQFKISMKLSYCKMKIQCHLFSEVFSSSFIQFIAVSSLLPKHFIKTFSIYMSKSFIYVCLSNYIVSPSFLHNTTVFL